ncbi:hypothetical protein ACFUEL_39420, partial [Kitasatospora sp. NPDC057198]
MTDPEAAGRTPVDRPPTGRTRALQLRRALRRLVPRSVRARATFAATAVVALALGGTAMALLGVLQANLTRDVRESAARQVDEVAAVAVREHLPPVISNPGGGSVRVFDAEGNLI